MILEKSQIKVQKIVNVLRTNNNTSYDLIFTLYPLSCKKTMHPEKSIIVKETTIGASTGPIHGKGMRNKISHVKKDGGQFMRSFNPI